MYLLYHTQQEMSRKKCIILLCGPQKPYNVSLYVITIGCPVPKRRTFHHFLCTGILKFAPVTRNFFLVHRRKEVAVSRCRLRIINSYVYCGECGQISSTEFQKHLQGLYFEQLDYDPLKDGNLGTKLN